MSKKFIRGVCRCGAITKTKSNLCRSCANKEAKACFITKDEFAKIEPMLVKARNLWVDVAKHVCYEVYESNVRLLSTKQRFMFPCVECGVEFETHTGREKGHKKHKWTCQTCAIAKEWKGDDYRHVHCEMISKASSTPESREKRSLAQKRKYQDPEFRERVTATLRKIWLTSAYRKKVSDSLKKRWATNPPKTQSKRYRILTSAGEIVVKSSYERNFARYLDGREFHWDYESRGFVMNSLDGRVLVPDFYVKELDLVVEIKGYFWHDAKEKWHAFEEEYPNIRKLILFKEDLRRLFTGEITLEDRFKEERRQETCL